jgi:tetratricopeptide (TPR) repeat protein
MQIRSVRVSDFLISLLVASLLVVLPTSSRAQSLPKEPPFSQDQQDARDTLNQGVEAFKNAQFEEAVRLFKRAKFLDPGLQNASLYLATAYASQYIPGAPSEENVRNGELATREFQEVLHQNPANLSAIDGIASILYQMAGQPFNTEKFEESKSYHKKHIELRPDDPQPYYSIGVIDWALAYRANSLLRAEFNQSVGVREETSTFDEDSGGNKDSEDQLTGLKNTDPLPEVLRRKYAEDYGPTIDEGLSALKRAIELKPDYDDAMVYLNLMYRQKADVVGPAIERNAYLEQADELLDKVKEIKQKRVSESQQ